MADLIDRQAAINALADYIHNVDRVLGTGHLTIPECKGAATFVLSIVPSAQPELDEWCTDCKEYDHERHCCPRWNRVIRETLKDAGLT